MRRTAARAPVARVAQDLSGTWTLHYYVGRGVEGYRHFTGTRSDCLNEAGRLGFERVFHGAASMDQVPLVELQCEHEWDEQPGEPPVDVCTACGAVRR